MACEPMNPAPPVTRMCPGNGAPFAPASDSWTSSSWRIEAYDDPAPEPEPRYRTAAKMSATKPTRSMGIRPEEETIASAEEVTRRGPEDRRAGFGYAIGEPRDRVSRRLDRVSSQTGPRLVGARRVSVKGWSNLPPLVLVLRVSVTPLPSPPRTPVTPRPPHRLRQNLRTTPRTRPREP